MKFNTILIVFTLVVLGMASCQKDDDYEKYKEYAPAEEVTGEYMVTWYLPDMTPYTDPVLLTIYNSSNGDSIWIDDMENFWQFKVKTAVSGNSFSVTDGTDLIWDDNTTITEGSVTESGDISMKVEWASDPGNVYICKGTRRTGFE